MLSAKGDRQLRIFTGRDLGRVSLFISRQALVASSEGGAVGLSHHIRYETNFYSIPNQQAEKSNWPHLLLVESRKEFQAIRNSKTRHRKIKRTRQRPAV